MDLTNHTEALRLIDDCKQLGVRIVGIEFFAGTKESFTPVGGTKWEGITRAESWHEARELLSGGIPEGGNLVEFVLDE